MQVGFHETMYGVCDDGRRFDFTITATAPLKEFANPRGGKFMLTKLRGSASLEQVFPETPISRGTLELDFFKDHQLKYKFNLEREDEFVNYTVDYEGEKILSLRNPIFSITTLYGRLKIEGENRIPYKELTKPCECGRGCPPPPEELLAEWKENADANDGIVVLPFSHEWETVSQFLFKKDIIPFVWSFVQNSGFK